MTMPSEDKKYYLDMTPQTAEQFLVECGFKKFRARQLADWVYKKGIVDPEQMKNVPADVRKCFTFSRSKIITSQKSKDATVKILLEYPDGARVESVVMPSAKRVTACVSTQVGCAVGCRFCASQLAGFQRNLSSGEILEQVIQLQLASGLKITNVVFMGMGEPLMNYDATVAAVRALVDNDRFGLSARRITVSTIGIPDKIRRLAGEDLPITLAISLHAPDDELRQKIIPYAEKVSISEIISAANEFYQSRNREVTLEYVMLGGVNCLPSHAKKLAGIAKRLRCNINLIKYNSVDEADFKSPSRESVEEFMAVLDRCGVNVTLRRSRGNDIDSACGQLRRRIQEQK